LGVYRFEGLGWGFGGIGVIGRGIVWGFWVIFLGVTLGILGIGGTLGDFSCGAIAVAVTVSALGLIGRAAGVVVDVIDRGGLVKSFIIRVIETVVYLFDILAFFFLDFDGVPGAPGPIS
jgi:hypothetical protein